MDEDCSAFQSRMRVLGYVLRISANEAGHVNECSSCKKVYEEAVVDSLVSYATKPAGLPA